MVPFCIKGKIQRFSLSNWEKYPYRSNWEKLSRENTQIGKNRVVKPSNWEIGVFDFMLPNTLKLITKCFQAVNIIFTQVQTIELHRETNKMLHFPKKKKNIFFLIFFTLNWEFFGQQLGNLQFFRNWESAVYRYFIKKEKNCWRVIC